MQFDPIAVGIPLEKIDAQSNAVFVGQPVEGLKT